MSSASNKTTCSLSRSPSFTRRRCSPSPRTCSRGPVAVLRGPRGPRGLRGLRVLEVGVLHHARCHLSTTFACAGAPDRDAAAVGVAADGGADRGSTGLASTIAGAVVRDARTPRPRVALVRVLRGAFKVPSVPQARTTLTTRSSADPICVPPPTATAPRPAPECCCR